MNGYATAAPLIARLGGLSADVIRPFSTHLGDMLDSTLRLEQELHQARHELVECLYSGITGAVAERRHALLAAKRDCFNGRSLTVHSHKPGWHFIEEVAGDAALRVLKLEKEIAEAKFTFESSFKAAASEQSLYLASLLGNPLLASGLAIASPVVARETHRLREKPPADYGRRERRLTATLLRYISRAALKLSPFSTFTAVGLAEPQLGAEPPVLAGGDWRRHSLVRLRRHLLDRCSDMLLLYRPWRERLKVNLNNSLFTLADGKVVYRRPSHFRPDELERKLRYHQESLVRMHLRGELAQTIKELLGQQALCYQELISRLRTGLGAEVSESVVVQQVDQLIDVGFLDLVSPWSHDEAHLEKSLLHSLAQLEGDTALEPLLSHLERLIQVEEGFLATQDPLAAFDQLDKLVDSTLQSAAALAGIPPHIDVTRRLSDHEIYQDVWCSPDDSGNHAVVRVGRAPLDEALRSIEPIVRFTALYDHRHDFLLTLGQVLRDRWPSRSEFYVLEAFDAVQPLWQDYIKFQLQNRQINGGWRQTWNPLHLASLEELALWRESAFAGMDSCMTQEPEGQRIEIGALNALLRPIPHEFVENQFGACMFLQPASSDGSLWMLNRLKEGTGRFASRYAPLMPEELRNHYGEQLRLRGTLQVGGETAQLLDIYCVLGDTLNVHAPQTPKVLVLSGEHVNVPDEQRLTLQDLVIALNKDGWPCIRDRSAARYLPVHLGVGYHDYLPTMVKFLCAFGPTELGAVFPHAWETKQDGMTVQHRTMIGNVVLHRKSWTVPLEELRHALDQSSESESFAAIHRWRRQRTVPEQVFVIERVPHPIRGFRYQPQYLDFTSPLFMSILRAITACDDTGLTLVETLPSPALFPSDEKGRTWALELLVDSLAMKAPFCSSNSEASESDLAALEVITKYA